MDISLDLFSFPFEQEGWEKRMLIGGLLALGGLLLTYTFVLMPLGIALMLPLLGFAMRVMRHAIRTGETVLPEWTDWGDLFKDGLRYVLVAFVYTLPVTLLICLGYGVMFGGMLALTPFTEQRPELAFTLIPLQFGGMAIIMIGVLLAIALGFLSVAAITRMVAHDSLDAAFEFGEVWALVKRGWKSFGLAYLLVFGISFAVSIAVNLLIYTICLICLVPFLMAVLVYYLQVIVGALFGLAYRAAEAGSSEPSEPSESGEPSEPSEEGEPSEPSEEGEPSEPSEPSDPSEPSEPPEAASPAT
jgi:hypothetical protein